MQQQLPPISTAVPASSTTLSNPSSNSSPFSPSHPQSQQAPPGQLPSRARIASSSSSQPPSSAASLTTATQGGVGASSGGGGASSRLARASPSLSQTASPSSAFPSSASGTQSQSLSKIVVAQIFVLLGTINQEKDKAKRETLAEQISALIAHHGMDVFPKFFRRALQLNQEYIFSNSNRNPEGSYELLLKHVQKIRQDPQEADNIAESIDSTEGDLFKNFDLSKFMDHFKLDPVAKSMLALALKNASKPDLRTKADAILSNNFQTLLMAILNPSETGDDLPNSYLYPLLDRVVREPPRNWSDESRTNLQFAIRSRFEKLGTEIPSEIMNVLQISDLLVPANGLVKLIHKAGPRGTSSLDACKEMLTNVEARDAPFIQVANALLFMVVSQDMGQPYDPSTFVATIRDHRCGKRLDWQDVVHSFDREGLAVTKRQFLSIYDALLPLAQEYENFDIQLLWGGTWTQPDTQLSFVVAFLSCSSDELDASMIPRLRKAFSTDDFEDASEEAKAYATEAVRHPFVSLDATKALFSMIFQSQETYKHANNMGIPETVINPHTDYFVLAVGSIPPPWGPLQSQAFNQLFTPFLRKRLPADNFVFHGLWKRPGLWLAHRLVEAYQANQMDLYFIYEHAQEHGWLPTLTSISSDFGVGLAALAHSRGQFNLTAWLEQSYNALPEVFPNALRAIVDEKARSEIASQRDPEAPPTVSLSVKTVFEFLNFLQPHLLPDEDMLVTLLKTCINAYPRLINFGEGVDRVIEENGKNGNALSQEADQSMNEHFKKLYSGESKVRDVIEALQRYKQSEDPTEQELFACMVNGLFDEYNCFSEYPVDALSTTAVLFGSIINFNLLPSIALQVGLALVLDSIQSSTSREENMYKFGLQALKQFQSRLHDWPSFCERLLRVPDLQGTEVWSIAEDVLRNANGGDVEGPGSPQALINGNADDYLEPAVRAFTCIHADPPRELHEAPTEDVQDKVLFVLNNVSPSNVEEKEADLKDVLDPKYHQWFAEYLVDQRAKLQSNFQNLYLTLLDLIDDKTLWQEVLRETYVSIVRLLNSESTMTSTTEKGHLKSLGSWLGSITLARDEPIKLRNISFKDLLIEAHASSRLPVVIPFTSKVLAEAAKSELFQPPNPWTVEILKVLLELYHHAELRINLKFEIETLCSTLNFDMKKTEPATAIRESMALAVEDEFIPGIPDGIEGFNELSLAGLSRNRANRSTFSPASLTEALPDISARLVYPPLSNSPLPAEHGRQVFLQAAQQAIAEIIFPVVERSVTIAAIAASQLVTKDFATEGDENKYRNAAHSLVKSLSGCLAMVTCREPLRMSMSNNVRALSRTLPGDGVPEGVILMFVNDNIDVVCRVIEEAAEKHSIAEIENQIREAVHVRQLHRSSHSDEGFNYPQISKWAYVIPEPYKPLFGGLRPEQLAIYEDFGPSRNMTSHVANASQDARQQITDVIQDQFTAVPNLPTPAEAPAVLRQATQHRILPGPGIPGTVQPQMNGFNEPVSLNERLEGLFLELLHAAREAPEDRIKDLGPAAPMREIYEQLAHVIDASGNQRDNMAMNIAHRIPGALYQESQRRLEIEVAVQLLSHLSQLSMVAARSIALWLAGLEEDRIFNAPVTACLVSARLLDLLRVDLVLSKALRQRKHLAIECLADMVEEFLLSDHPLAIRANFANSFEVLLQWVHDDPDLESAKAILNKLQVPEPTNALATLTSNKQDQIEHVFDEWLHLNRPDVPEKMVATFIRQLYMRGFLKSQEDTAVFLRLCLDISVAAYEQEEAAPYGGSIDLAYLHIDALASLVISLVVYQGIEADGAVKPSSGDFLDSILSIVVLYQAHHYNTRAEAANQKIFFRLYSGLLCDIHNSIALDPSKDDIYLVMSRAFLAIQPNYFPGFAFAWLGLITHRIFMPVMITMPSELAIQRYNQLLHITFQTLGNLARSSEQAGSVDFIHRAQDYHRAVLRILVVIHHDFPDFLVENHLSLCNSLPEPLVQLKNLVLSAVPSSFPELPSPFSAGLKVDLLPEMRLAPTIRNDFVAPLRDAGILRLVDNLLATMEHGPQDISKLCHLLQASPPTNAKSSTAADFNQFPLIHALVIYIGFQGISASSVQVYTKSAPHASILFALVRQLRAETRCQLIHAMINQLRFPNSHTHYFMCSLIDIFCMPPADDVQDEIQEVIVRTLLERLAVQRPHPWGVIVALLELYKNGNYQFWDLPFVKASPEVERLFAALNNHINNSPRALA